MNCRSVLGLGLLACSFALAQPAAAQETNECQGQADGTACADGDGDTGTCQGGVCVEPECDGDDDDDANLDDDDDDDDCDDDDACSVAAVGGGGGYWGLGALMAAITVASSLRRRRKRQ